MPTTDDLITKALHDHAATVTHDMLRFPEYDVDRAAPTPQRRRPARPSGTAIAVAASIAAVLVIAVGIFALRSGQHHSDRVADSGSRNGLVGTEWQLVSVANAVVKPMAVPRTYRAELTFHANGTFTGHDGPHTLTGRFRTSSKNGKRLMLSTTAITGEGSTATPGPAQLAMSSVYVTNSLDVTAATSTYFIQGPQLTVQSPSWILTFKAR